MQESIRRTLLDTKVLDIEVKSDKTTFILENKYGACYSVEIMSGKSNTILLDDLDEVEGYE